MPTSDERLFNAIQVGALRVLEKRRAAHAARYKKRVAGLDKIPSSEEGVFLYNDEIYRRAIEDVGGMKYER